LCSLCYGSIDRVVKRNGAAPDVRPAAGRCGAADERGCEHCHRLR
jgi:hypothetical protein